MKILQLGKFHPIGGGVEKVMVDIADGLASSGHTSHMLCAAKGKPHSIFLPSGAGIFAVRSLARIAATMISPAMILRLRKTASHYDIIHIHHPDPMAALALRMSGFHGRLVLHWHSDILRQKRMLRLINPLLHWLIDRADVIVGTSPVYLSQSPALVGASHKFAVVPIGIDPLPDPDPLAVERIRARFPGKHIIFSMGRLVSYKGLEFLIDAAQYLPDNFVVVIGGTGPLQRKLQLQIQTSRLSGKVFLEGFIPGSQLSAYYHAAACFVLSSVEKTEAFGIVQIEAMSCGTPVVATSIPGSGAPWVNADGVSGINVPPRDSSALADAIVRTVSRRDEFSSGAIRRYDSLFTKQLMTTNINTLYKSLF